MEHIEVWKERKRREEARREVERERQDREKEEVAQKFRDILAKRGVTKMYTNGYVYEFQFKGWVYHFVNQKTRLCCTIHRPFTSKDDEECYRDMQSQMSRGNAESFVKEYGYQDFIIQGNPVSAFKELLLY